MKTIFVPGSKSITNRVLLLAAISDKPVVLKGVLDSDDARYMQEALKTFGVKIEYLGKNTLKVYPAEALKANGQEIFIGNAGTAARFLSALSLVVEGRYTLTGIERMQERPQEDLMKALEDLGVGIECHKNEGYLPASFLSKEDIGSVVKISGKVSSQFLSGLMLVASRLVKGLTIEVVDGIPSRPYIEMTLSILKIWGVRYKVNNDFSQFVIHSGITAPEEYLIPSDMSSASYPLLWSVLSGESISIENFGSQTLQGDEQFLEVIKTVGAQVERKGDRCVVQPPEELLPMGDWNWESMPDVSMTGMVLAAFCPGKSKFTGLESLRVKECDRIVAMEQLAEIGVSIKVDKDEVVIEGHEYLKHIKYEAPLEIDSFDDHRIAMCFGVLKAALDWGSDPYQESVIRILEPECVAKTWPKFWLELSDWEDQLRPVSALVLHRIGSNCGKDKYLIVKKPRKNHAWQFPQGGQDEGETAKQAAIRELQEECGETLNAKIKGERPVGEYKYFFPSDFDRHDDRIVGAKVSFFLAEFISGSVEVDGNEIIDHKWVTLEEFSEYFEGEYLEVVQDFFA